MRAVIVPGLLTGALATTAGAQEQPATFVRWEPRIAGELDSGSASGLGRESVAAGHRDYRYEGLVVGGLAIGAFGAWVGSQISAACPTEPGVECGPDNRGNAIAVGLVGAAIGGGLGYVVGRLSSKAGPMPPTVEVP
jgi:hypothetical protein